MNRAEIRKKMKEYAVPEHLREGLEKYLRDKLSWAVMKADRESLRNIKNIVLFLWNEVPMDAWGSKKKVEQWLREKDQQN